MMRSVLAVCAMMVLTAFFWAKPASALADGEQMTSTNYDVYVSAGGDAYVIFGDGTAFQVTQPSPACAPNKAVAVSEGGFLVEMGPTDIVSGGLTTRFGKVVLYIAPNGACSLVWAE